MVSEMQASNVTSLDMMALHTDTLYQCASIPSLYADLGEACAVISLVLILVSLGLNSMLLKTLWKVSTTTLMGKFPVCL